MRGCYVFNYSFERKLQKGKNYSDDTLLALDLIIDDNRVTVININGSKTDFP